jgi:hypothetical protein
MALLTDEQAEEITALGREALNALEVQLATLDVVKRRLERVVTEADLVLDKR